MVTIRTTDGTRHPITPAKGVTEQSFREGDKNILGTPSRQFSSGIPMTERASLRTKLNYAKSLTKRFDEATASGKARKAEKNREKELRNREADRNLQLASMFFERQNKIRKGENLPPIDINVDVNTNKPTIPKNIPKNEMTEMKKQQNQETEHESNIIEKLTEPSKQEQPTSPAFVPSSQLSSDEQNLIKNPKQKSSGSLSSLALEKYPARG